MILNGEILKGVEYFLLILGFLGKYANTQWVIDDSGCRTPDNGIGNCISIYDCEPIITALNREKRPLAPEIQAQFEAYACGSDSNGFKVCCPNGPVILKRKEENFNNNNNNYNQHRNFYLLPKKCGIYTLDDRIVNGENALLNEFPWMALLEYKGRKSGFLCGGTIINKNYILTAAHCLSTLKNSQLNNVSIYKKLCSNIVNNFNQKLFAEYFIMKALKWDDSKIDISSVSVRVGEHNLQTDIDCQLLQNKTRICNPPVQNLRIEEIISHPRFTSDNYQNDIGLIRVSTMNLDSESTRPVCLPITDQQRTSKYNSIFVTGWGVTNPETGKSADILQRVKLPIKDKASCISLYEQYQIQLSNKQICAGGVKKMDSCSGDSGGPMLVPEINENGDTIYVQQGVVSFGPKNCGLEGYAGVYTLVAPYVDWILDTIKP